MPGTAFRTDGGVRAREFIFEALLLTMLGLALLTLVVLLVDIFIDGRPARDHAQHGLPFLHVDAGQLGSFVTETPSRVDPSELRHRPGDRRDAMADGGLRRLHHPGGGRQRRLPRGVREPRALVPALHRGQHPEPRRGSLDRLRRPRPRLPGPRPALARQRRPRRRADARPAGAAGGDRRRPRGDPRRAPVDPRGLDGARGDQVADDLEAGAARVASPGSRPGRSWRSRARSARRRR